MNTQANTEVQHYLDRMRESLADLPAAEVGEIMDDAGAHVVEVAEEMGEDFSLAALTDRLGTPQAYARELRAAAGYPPPETPQAGPAGVRPMLLARFAFWSLVAGTVMAFAYAVSRGDSEELTLLVGLCLAAAVLLVFRQSSVMPEIAKLPEAIAVKDVLDRVERSDSNRVLASLRTLQPVWWVGRALLIAALGVMGYYLGYFTALALVLAALSLFAGPKARTDRRWLWISLPATGFALGALLLVLGSMVTRFDYGGPAPVSYHPQPPVPDNIYVFDKDGKPLTDVHLYDEDGNPLDSPWYGCEGSSRREDNRYPRPRVVHDENGCREIPGVPPFTIVVPNTTPSTGTSPTPSASTPPSSTPPSSAGSVPPTPVTPTG